MVDFNTLWRNHPMNGFPMEDCPCRKPDGQPTYENQCAIRLGVCLVKSGIKLANYHGKPCGYHPGRGHALVAEELAAWINLPSTTFVDYAEKSSKVTFADYAGRTGIVLCRNFWRPDMSGDHIDLWDGTRFARGDTSFFGRSQEVWFWELD
jgi:Type VI secretion system (T6SS), amidase effector protein 4